MRGSVRGSVVRAENGDAIAGATILGSPARLLPSDRTGSSPHTQMSARSDRSGGFGFDNLLEGEWVFTTQGARGQTLGEATVQVFDNALTEVTIAVRGMLSGSPGDRGAEPPRARSTPPRILGAVRGRVVHDFDGKAVSGATIAVVSGEGSEPDVLPMTDADGWFALDGLSEGEWLLRVLGPAGESGTATVHVFDNALSEVTIEVGSVPRAPRRGGATRSSHRSERSMRGSLRGRVVRRDTGAPVPDATITVVTGAGPAPDIAPVTNNTGMFALDGLPPGDWVLRAIAPDGGTGEATARVSAAATADMVIYISTTDRE